MRIVALAVVLVVGFASGAAAQAPEDRAASISERVMSPFCPGLALHDCPTQEAVDLRTQIQEWTTLGWSNSRIFDRLEDEYGPAIRAVPAGGSGVLARSLPALALLGGLALTYVLGRRWTKRGQVEPAVTSGPSASERARLEAELASLRRNQGGAR